MSHFLDRLSFFTRAKAEFADGHGVMTTEDRSWEDGYASQIGVVSNASRTQA